MKIAIAVQNVGVGRVNTWKHAAAVRPWWRIYWNRTPGAVVCFGNRDYVLDRKSILVIPPDTSVEQRLLQVFETFYVHVSFGMPYDRCRGNIFQLPVTDLIRPLLARAVASVEAGEGSVILGAYLTAVLAELPVDFRALAISDHRIGRCVEMMEESAGEHWSNTELAEIAGLSRNAFVRLFRQNTGRPPQAYLLKIRLEKSCEMLANSDCPVDEIAQSMGFCDRSYFTRQFRKVYAMGPGTYRKLSPFIKVS